MYPVPQKTRPRREGSGLLWLAQAIIAVFRVFLRVQELFGSRRRREQAGAFRQKMDVMRRDQGAMLKRMEGERGWDRFDALDEFVAQHGDAEDRERHEESRRHLQTMRQESEALQLIRREAGEDRARAVQGYRDYLREHPESHSACSYLGGALRQMGDFEGSLAAYHEALRLAEGQPIPAAMNRLSLGTVLKEKGAPEAALAEWRSVIENGTSSTEVSVSSAYLCTGDLLSERGDRDGARTAWRQARKWDRTGILAKEARKRLARKA